MAGYADLSTVAILIAPAGQDDLITGDTAVMTRLGQINDAMSTLFDQECLGGEVAPGTPPLFGGSAAAAARQVFSASRRTVETILVLPVPIRSVTGITITGDYAATLAATDYALTYPTKDCYLGIRRLGGGVWPPDNGRSVITVTGIWMDTPLGGSVPAIVVEALNFIVTEQWRLDQASPAEEIGPDGQSVKPRNPWNYALVKKAIARYRVTLPKAGF